MGVTQHLREQHESIVALTSEISRHLHPGDLPGNVHQVRSLLSQLTGTLSVHLNMEDLSLYPLLIEDRREDVSGLARSFMHEMGGISETLGSYRRRWGTNQAVLERPQTFIDETVHLFTVLRKRIDRENRELYPLLEK